MKIITATFVYNDHEYLHETLESIKDFGDKHFIIEGSWQSAQKNGASPRSNELTYDIINKHVDNKRVFLIQANEAREREQRQVGLELAKKENADWFFMTDSDEVYPKNQLQIIKNVLSVTQDTQILGFRLNSKNFINSFKKWYKGNYMRIYRVTPEAKFVMDNDVIWPDGDPNGFVGAMPSESSFFHYNYVRRNTDTFWLKMKYQNNQDPTFWKRMIESGQYKEENGVYKIPDSCTIYEYTGAHPQIMKDHTYFRDNIFGDGEIKFF